MAKTKRKEMTADRAAHVLNSMLIVNAENERPAIDMAIQALKRNEPVRPVMRMTWAYGAKIKVRCCGKCGGDLYGIAGLYCTRCGQAIDWKGVNDL